MVKKHIPATVRLFLKMYLIAVGVFFVFRLILFLTELGRVEGSSSADVIGAFVMGIRFDVVISGYVALIPFLALAVHSFFNRQSRLLVSAVKYYLIALFSLAFAVSAADIPYFNHFFSHFSVAAFQWIDSPAFVAKMILQEPRYWLTIIPFVLLFAGFYKLVDRLFLEYKNHGKPQNIYSAGGVSLLFLLLIVVGIRGRLEEKSPIRVGTAYFCNNPFLNQLGLNPNFTLVRSLLDAQKKENNSISLMNNGEAVANVQSYLNIARPDSIYPLLRKVDFDTLPPNNYNVVVVIMESMSAAKMTRHGNPDRLTPFLDSISQQGYYFENAYTAGIHTMNGIFSTLFSFPALFRQHPMKDSEILRYNGLIPTLRTNGYSTIYFTTHDGQFDNVEGFLKANDCEKVVTKADYPQDEVKTTLGVPDDYMFGFSIPLLNELSNRNKPFFAAYMTASDHGPYYLPEYFKPRTGEIKKQIVEFADYSLRKLIEAASREKWFDNTIFVFIADHGAAMDNLYDMSLTYHHTPLLFYSPRIIKEHKTFDKIAGQIDVFPSIMGLLQIPYYNNTLGIDLFRENRDYIFLNADDKYGVIDKDWFLIVKDDRSRSLFKYRDQDRHNYVSENPEVADKMDVYAKSNLQTFQFLKDTKKQDAGMARKSTQ